MNQQTSIALLGCLAILGSGCDDVLEACQSCPDVLGGQTSVSGDPRLDHSLEAAVRIGQQARTQARRLEGALEAALRAYGLTSGPGALSVSTAETLWEAAQHDLGRVDMTVSLGAEPAACSVDGLRLTEDLLACQERIGCYVSKECKAQRLSVPRALCAGLCAGPCDTDCRGYCLSEPSSDGLECDGWCLGACVPTQPAPCSGSCFGACDGRCSSLSDDGRCQGKCFGVCDGACSSTSAQRCAGTCHGRCGEQSQGACVAPLSCRGECLGDGCLGECLGLVEPVPCDTGYCPTPADLEGLAQCRVALRDLSLSELECGSGRAVIAVSFGEPVAPDAAAVLARLRVLEQSLSVALDVQAWAALLLDGTDPAGELEESWLTQTGAVASLHLDPVDAEEASVPSSLADKPLWAFKRRLYGLSLNGLSYGVEVPAGVATCVPDSFRYAHQLLETLLPVTAGASGKLSFDRLAEGSLARLLDTAAAMTAPLREP